MTGSGEPKHERVEAAVGSVVGRRLPKVGSHEAVRGTLPFTADLTMPGMLHARLVRSPHPHARILKVDASEALALPGVHAVVTGADMPRRYGILPWTQDEYPLAHDKARFVGDAVACVAASTEEIAAEAARRVRVDYEVLPPVLDPHEALKEEAPRIHEDNKRGNVTKRVRLAFGDLEAARADSDVVVENDFLFEGTTHVPLEPHCALAHWEPSGVLTVVSTTQVPHYLHRELSRVLDVPMDRIRVVQPPIGGAFGGKSEPFDLEFCVAWLARATGRPVRLLYSREEVFYAHRGRHPVHMHYEVGARADGTLTFCDARLLLDGGAYASFGLVTTYYAGQLVTGPVRLQAYRYESTRVYTNKPACGPKRGHGSVQPRFAFESALDMLAERLGMDPIELRRRNALRPGERTVNELLVRSTGFLGCLDAVEEASGWRDKFRRLPVGRGIGVAGSFYISGTNYPIYPNEMPQSAVQIKIDRSGRVTVFSGASEIGQGSDTVLAMVAAEVLGVQLEAVRVVSGDTDLCPVDLGAYSSRQTLMTGEACRRAALQLAGRVRRAVAKRWDCSPKRVALAGGWALDRRDTARKVPVAEAFQWAEADEGTLGAVGHYDTPKDNHGDYRGGTIGASPAYSFTAHVVQVAVDPETGFVEVERAWVAHDPGKALNPMLVEGQIEGSTYMGLAEALLEAQIFHDGGLHRGPNLLDYRIPTSLDTPPIEALIVEGPDERGPFGAKEAGEGPLHGAIPALANAIYDAVGVRLTRLPFTPARVLEALEAQGGPRKPPVPGHRNGEG